MASPVGGGGHHTEATFWQQYTATLNRNILRKKRTMKHTLTEILSPIYFIIVIVIIALVVPAPFYPEVVESSGVGNVFEAPAFLANQSTIYVVPDDIATKDFIGRVGQHAAFEGIEFKFLATEEEFDDVFDEDEAAVYAGIIFNNSVNQNLDYRIRLTSQNIFLALPTAAAKTGAKSECRLSEDDIIKAKEAAPPPLVALSANNSGPFPPCKAAAYFSSGFATIQSVIDHTWLKEKNSDHEFPDLGMKFLPKASSVGNNAVILRSIIPIYMVMSLSQFIPPMLMVVVDEKEKKIKESMRMVGLRDSVFWLSWLTVYSVSVTICVIIMTILTKVVIIRSANFFLLFLLIELGGLSMIMIAFVTTAMFSNAKAAANMSGMVTMFLACTYYIQVFAADSPEWVFWLLALISPSGFAMGFDRLMVFDIDNKPIDLWDAAGSISVAGVLIMLTIDIFFYGFLAYYLDNIIPTEYGTVKEPFFCLRPSFWRKKSRSRKYTGVGTERTYIYSGVGVNVSNRRVVDESKFIGENMESVPSTMDGHEAIIIEDIKKSYSSCAKPTVDAVQGVSLRIYEGEITAILGHNGAGKTTLFNMLTGMTTSSSGEAHIFGYNINNSNEMEEIRKMTGICPQHDVLFDELSPAEHLAYFARIRGMARDKIDNEVKTILSEIDLSDKADELAGSLSGGQKRKLSVGIALIGDPKIIFLDEPTAGVDPYSRRHMWSILKKRKEGKVILLTTHFMDEADILADRKAILSQGKLKCFGTSLFLKNKFGVGYHMTMVLEPDADLPGIRTMIESHVPGAAQNRLFGRELSYVLPRDEIDNFPKLFSAMEKDASSGEDKLGIDTFGVSMTTLEEIFLQLGEEEDALKDEEDAKKSNGTTNGTVAHETNGKSTNGKSANKDMSGYSFESVPTNKTQWQMFKALFFVRFVRKYREPMAVLVQIFFPLLYIVIGLSIINITSYDVVQDKAYAINADIYKDTFEEEGLHTFSYINNAGQSVEDLIQGLSNDANGTLQLQPGIAFEDLLKTMQMTTFDIKSKSEIDILFNFTALQSIPVSINSLSNMYATSYGLNYITVTSQPLKAKTPPTYDYASFAGAMFVGFCYLMMPIGLAMELIEDRELRCKNQLRVNGFSFGLYYATFFVLMAAMMVAMLIMLVILMIAFDLKALIVPPSLFVIITVFLLWIPASIMHISSLSYMFDTIENGQFLFPMYMYMALIPYMAVTVVDMLQVMDGELGRILHAVFCILIPPYMPFGCLYVMGREYLLSGCSFIGTCDQLSLGADYLSKYQVWIMYVACFIHIIWFFFDLRVKDVQADGLKTAEAWKVACFMKRREDRGQSNPEEGDKDEEEVEEEEDSDVNEERLLISNYMGRAPEYSAIQRVVAVKGLRKEFEKTDATNAKAKKDEKNKESKKKIAVRNLTLAVEEGEVFGLLGHNGAGKTTSMKIITAEEAPTRGKVRIDKYDITNNMSPGFEHLGYCPQFDAIWKTITIQEHLETYAAIRGVPRKDIDRLVNQYMEGLHIKEHANKFTKDCSGGTNRKLSYAMSMLGNPKIVLLDEPSTGMDPRSKRFVWDTVLASFQKDRGAILTTHSMEEADALCNRVGIMVKGELRCLGSTQHLKNKYGGGYMLEIKLKHTDTSEEKWIEVEANIKSSFEEATLTESFVDRRTYAIPQSAVSSLASAFTSLEELKVRFDIEEYSFGQTTLEQVFIEFAKLQEAANIDDGDIGDNADDETTNNIMKIRRQHSANSSNGNAVNVSDI